MNVCIMSGEEATADDYQSIAVYFEQQKNHLMAGKFFLMCSQYARVSKVVIETYKVLCNI